MVGGKEMVGYWTRTAYSQVLGAGKIIYRPRKIKYSNYVGIVIDDPDFAADRFSLFEQDLGTFTRI